MSYGVKTPDGKGLHKVVHKQLPQDGKDYDVWPVETAIPPGFHQTGWVLENGIVKPTLVPDKQAEVPPPPEPVPDLGPDLPKGWWIKLRNWLRL